MMQNVVIKYIRTILGRYPKKFETYKKNRKIRIRTVSKKIPTPV